MASLHKNRSKKNNNKNTMAQVNVDQASTEDSLETAAAPILPNPTSEEKIATVAAADSSDKATSEEAPTELAANVTTPADNSAAEAAIEFTEETPEFLLLRQIGKLLQEARCARGLSVADVAMHLKLRTTQVKAIEEGQTQNLPNPIFVRGFIRGYTRFVGMDDDATLNQLINHWSQAVDLPFIPTEAKNSILTDPPTPAIPTSRRCHSLPKWLFYIVIIAFILVLIFLWQSKSDSLRTEENHEASALNEVPRAPALSHDNVLVVPLQPNQNTAPAEEVSPTNHVAAAEQTTTESTVTKVASDTVLAIAIKYRSYLTVRDGSHKVLIDQIVPGGSNFQWSGNNPPYQVRIGYATGSTVEYAGEAFPIDSYINDRTAVFTVPAP